MAVAIFVACSSLVEVQQRDTLYFGTAKPGGVVSEIEWRAFVNDVITPRFDGHTEWLAEGHWKGAKEATHVVEIVHPPRAENDRKIGEIIAEYKRRFQQEAVLLVRERALATLQ
jgi:hypothetical protein